MIHIVFSFVVLTVKTTETILVTCNHRGGNALRLECELLHILTLERWRQFRNLTFIRFRCNETSVWQFWLSSAFVRPLAPEVDIFGSLNGFPFWFYTAWHFSLTSCSCASEINPVVCQWGMFCFDQLDYRIKLLYFHQNCFILEPVML